jgi:hypothetical protein
LNSILRTIQIYFLKPEVSKNSRQWHVNNSFRADLIPTATNFYDPCFITWDVGINHSINLWRDHTNISVA